MTLLSSLLDAAGVRALASPGADPMISGATLDSRRVSEGDVFFALPGEVTDGERFVPQATAPEASCQCRR